MACDAFTNELGCIFSFPDLTTYLTVGDAVASLALFVGFSSILRPIQEFRLRVEGFGRLQALVMFVLAISAAIMAALIPDFGVLLPFPFNLPLFWQLLSAVWITGTSVYFIYIIYDYRRFYRHNAVNWFVSVRSFLMVETIENLADLSRDISQIWPQLIRRSSSSKLSRFDIKIRSFIYRYRPMLKIFSQFERAKKWWYQTQTGCAWEILNLLADDNFCRAVVTRNPIAAIVLFQFIEQKQIVSEATKPLVSNLVHLAIGEEHSQMKREEGYTGLGLRRDFSTILMSGLFLPVNYRVLGAWEPSYFEDVKTWQIERYNNLVSLFLKKAFTTQEKYPRDLSNCWIDISETFERIVRNSKDQGTSLDNMHYATYIIRSMMSTVERGSEYTLPQIPSDKGYGKHETYQERSFYMCCAEIIFTYFDSLSRKEYDSGFSHYSRAWEVWSRLYEPHDTDENPYKQAIQARFEAQLFPQLERNLTWDSAYYPMLLRILFIVYGWQGIDDTHWKDKGLNGYNRVRIKFKELIDKHFYDAWVKNPRPHELLCYGSKYDSKTRIITFLAGPNDDRTVTYQLPFPKPSRPKTKPKTKKNTRKR